MNQSDLDVWEVRGLQAILKILSERARASIPYSPRTVASARVHSDSLAEIVALMEAQTRPESVDPVSDIARLDRWFYTGLDTLSSFMVQRLQEGGPMNPTMRFHIQNLLTDMLARMSQ